MAYQISYLKKGIKKRKIIYIKISLVHILAVAILIALAWGHIALGSDFDHTLHMLFPWTDLQTREAFSVMEESLSQGIPLQDVVDTFCKDLIQKE